MDNTSCYFKNVISLCWALNLAKTVTDYQHKPVLKIFPISKMRKTAAGRKLYQSKVMPLLKGNQSPVHTYNAGSSEG